MEDKQEKIDEVERAKQFFRSRKKDAFFLVASVFFGIFLEWNIVEIAIFTILIWAIIGPISVRILAAVALFFLSIVPFLLVLDREVQAEQYAVYAYYFLVMAVIRSVIDLRAESKSSY